MLYVTERAKDHLLRTKLAIGLDHCLGFRLTSASGGRLVLIADQPKPSDQVVRYKQSTVLLIDGFVAESVLAGRTVDCRRTENDEVEIVVMSVAPAAAAAVMSSASRPVNRSR